MRVVEAMRVLSLGPFWQVRLWIASEGKESDDRIHEQALAVARKFHEAADLQIAEADYTFGLANTIAAILGINAVEVTNGRSGEGHVIYPEWP